MKLLCAMAIGLLFVTPHPPQEMPIDDLLKKLDSTDFEVQGKAAKDLEQMGRSVLGQLRRLSADEATSERIRTWCRWIVEKIELKDKRFKELIERLGSGDDEVKESAEAELKRVGGAAVPYLLELRNSADRNLRRRADKLVQELGTADDLLVWEGKLTPAGEPPVKRAAAKPESSVLSALKWLARHQNPDGSWGATSFANHCVGGRCVGAGDPEFDAGITGLALLAFLGAGYTHQSREDIPDPLTPGKRLRFGDTVKSGLKWLMSKQDPEGCIGGRGTKYMYNHAIATAALAEAYGLTAAPLYRGPAQEAVNFIVASQNPDRGWRYTKQSGDNDTSVTGWAVHALKSAQNAELKAPYEEAYEKASKWFDEATDATLYHRVGYNGKGSGKVFVPGKNEDFTHHEAMTAVAVSSRIFMRADLKDPALGGVALLVKDLPVWKRNEVDCYYWYQASLALFQYDGPDGPYWKKWSEPMRLAIASSQKTLKDGCADGSWPSDEDRWGFEGGRVYAAAINALTLETTYRFPPPRK